MCNILVLDRWVSMGNMGSKVGFISILFVNIFLPCKNVEKKLKNF